MLLPMGVLALGCLAIGLFPRVIAPLMDHTAALFAANGATPLALTAGLGESAPLSWLAITAPVLLAAMFAGLAALQLRISLGKVGSIGTWGCGYAAPETSMQYTSSSFGQMLVLYFAWALRPLVRLPVIDRLFPANQSFESRVPDAALEGAVEPAAEGMAHLSAILRILQNGSIQIYLLYFLGTLLVVPLIPWMWDVLDNLGAPTGR